MLGENYKVSAADIPGYILVGEADISGKFTNVEDSITFTYKIDSKTSIQDANTDKSNIDKLPDTGLGDLRLASLLLISTGLTLNFLSSKKKNR